MTGRDAVEPPPAAPATFTISSRLAVPPAMVWRHAVDPRSLNREFAPWLRMTFPRHVRDLSAAWAPGRRIGRCWLLAFGVLPVEYDDLTFVLVEPGVRFVERSTMLTQRLWEHERVLEPIVDGCRVDDRIAFVPRLRWLTPLCRPIFAATFRHRHRRLRALFGSLD